MKYPEQLSMRVPDGTKARLRSLSKPPEALVDVLLRAIDALEYCGGAEPSLSLGDSLGERLGFIEQRLSALEKEPRLSAGQGPMAMPTIAYEQPKPPPARDTNQGRNTRYSEADRRYAIDMKRLGYKRFEIAAELERRTGRRPNEQSLSTQLKTWAKQYGIDMTQPIEHDGAQGAERRTTAPAEQDAATPPPPARQSPQADLWASATPV